MRDLVVKAVVAGIAWGIWPLVINKSGVSGYVSATGFSAVVLLVTLPFALWDTGGNTVAATTTGGWVLVGVAGIISAIGLMMFTGMLAKASVGNVTILVTLTFLVEAAIQPVYQIVASGRLYPSRIIGFLAALVAIFFLTRK